MDSGAFAAELSFLKPMLDQYGVNFVAPAWGTVNVGTHNGDRSFVIDRVGVSLSVFLDRYTDVNGPACRPRTRDN